MRASSAANDAVMADAIKLVHEGVTSAEIADQMLGLYRARTAARALAPPIVSFGANAGDLHHEPDDTVRAWRGDVVPFDTDVAANLLLGHDAHVFGASRREETGTHYDIVRRQRGRRGTHRTGRAHATDRCARRRVAEDAAMGSTLHIAWDTRSASVTTSRAMSRPSTIKS